MARRKNRKIFPPPRSSPRQRKKKDRKRRVLLASREPLLPVGRLRERQYQIAAQKRNEAFLKYTTHTQTARYFERECGNAKHYSSWNNKDFDPKKLVDKAKKEARLAIRRKSLSELLKVEEVSYRKELQELLSRKKQRDLASLESSKENRVEQSPHFVKTGRRYTYSPKSSISTLLTDIEIANQSFSPSICRGSLNSEERSDISSLYRRLGRRSNMDRSESFPRQDNVDRAHCTNMQFFTSETENLRHHSTRYSSRTHDRSLENTNMRREIITSEDQACDPDQPGENPVLEKSANSQSVEQEVLLDLNATGGSESKDKDQKETEQHEKYDSGKEDEINEEDQVDRVAEPNDLEDDLREKMQGEQSARNARDKAGQMITDHRQFESEKSMPWLRMIPNDKNLSEQMFLYLTHQEMMHQIDDLTKRESHACTKQSWDEALRLRDMKNRLELLREKRLFNMDSLKMDEDIRSLGLASIEKRAEELAHREEACTNSNMYSEEAKELWKRWVQEDEKSPIKLARQKREDVMKDLEVEWHNLAIEEKDKITRSFKEPSTQNDSGPSANASHGKTKSLLHPTIY